MTTLTKLALLIGLLTMLAMAVLEPVDAGCVSDSCFYATRTTKKG